MRSLQLIAVLVVPELFIAFIDCKRTDVQDSEDEEFEHKHLSKLFAAISRAKESIPFKRRNNDGYSEPMRYFYKTLSNTVDVEQFKNWLRQEAPAPSDDAPSQSARDELAGLVEVELLNALSKKSSAILDKPFIQKKGRNDFLVIRSDPTDPFVTVVPNDIYYNAEKKCVNWLDDCNQKGLRARLLQRVQGPYK